MRQLASQGIDVPGQLFTHYFIGDGIRATPQWRASVEQPAAFDAFTNAVTEKLNSIKAYNDPNESVTEQDLIRPVLELLGWADYLPQQGAARNEDIPDHLLFDGQQSKARAAARPNSGERYQDALVVQESKRLGLPLDSRDKGDKVQPRSPHGQILRYLETAGIVTDGRIRWGILTNGSRWRLYDHRARPRASAYYEVDLRQLLDHGGEDGLRTFFLLFHRDSFIPQHGATTTFLEDALAEGRRYEERVAQDLSGVVFDTVFPSLVESLANASDAPLPDVRKPPSSFSTACYSCSTRRTGDSCP